MEPGRPLSASCMELRDAAHESNEGHAMTVNRNEAQQDLLAPVSYTHLTLPTKA